MKDPNGLVCASTICAPARADTVPDKSGRRSRLDRPMKVTIGPMRALHTRANKRVSSLIYSFLLSLLSDY
jgi:hypothetical protein